MNVLPVLNSRDFRAGQKITWKGKEYKVAYTNRNFPCDYLYVFIHHKNALASWTTMKKIKIEEIDDKKTWYI